MKRKKNQSPEGEDLQLVLGEIKTSKPPAAEQQLISGALTDNEEWFINYVKHLDAISAENGEEPRKAEKTAPTVRAVALPEPRDSGLAAVRQSIMTSIPDDILWPNDTATSLAIPAMSPRRTRQIIPTSTTAS